MLIIDGVDLRRALSQFGSARSGSYSNLRHLRKPHSMHALLCKPWAREHDSYNDGSSFGSRRCHNYVKHGIPATTAAYWRHLKAATAAKSQIVYCKLHIQCKESHSTRSLERVEVPGAKKVAATEKRHVAVAIHNTTLARGPPSMRFADT